MQAQRPQAYAHSWTFMFMFGSSILRGLMLFAGWSGK